MSRFEGDVAGKNIFTYRSRGGKEYSPNDIGQYLRKFKLNDALRLIGESSYKRLRTIKDIPVCDGVLAYLSMRLIESSNERSLLYLIRILPRQQRKTVPKDFRRGLSGVCWIALTKSCWRIECTTRMEIWL